MKPSLLAALLVACAALADIGPRDDEKRAEPPPPAPVAEQPVAEQPAPTAPVAEAAPTPAPSPQHPVGIEKAMGAGVIQGGWEYVYAAYGLGVLGVLAFAASLFVRRPKAQPGSAP